MNIPVPSFVKREPKVNVPVRDDDPETASIMQRIMQTRRERDDLRARLNQSEADNGELTREVDFLKAQLREAEKRRDFYQGHYVSLFTRLSTVAMTVTAAIEESKAEQAARIGRPQEPAQDLNNDQRMKDLAAKLAPKQDHQEEQAQS